MKEITKSNTSYILFWVLTALLAFFVVSGANVSAQNKEWPAQQQTDFLDNLTDSSQNNRAPYGYLGYGQFNTRYLKWCHYGSYYSESYYAVSRLNANSDIYLYGNCNYWNVATWGSNFGNDGFAGYAYICEYQNGISCDDYYYNNQFADCTARLNTYFLGNRNTYTKQALALHEIGHCLSLSHRSNSSSMMRADIFSYPNHGYYYDWYLINNRY